jgi:hypothetical protein
MLFLCRTSAALGAADPALRNQTHQLYSTKYSAGDNQHAQHLEGPQVCVVGSALTSTTMADIDPPSITRLIAAHAWMWRKLY